MPKDSVREQRQQRHRRMNVRLLARISTIDPELDLETGQPYFRSSEETCHNVSRGGAFIATDEPLTPGRRLLLELELPGEQQVQTIGRVAWSKARLSSGVPDAHSGIGVEFLGGSPAHFSTLERYINRVAQANLRPSADTSGPTPRPRV